MGHILCRMVHLKAEASFLNAQVDRVSICVLALGTCEARSHVATPFSPANSTIPPLGSHNRAVLCHSLVFLFLLPLHPLRVEWWKPVVIDSGELSYKVLSEHLLVETVTVNDTWVVGLKLLHDQE